MVMLPGQHNSSVGEQYGRGFEKPLVAVAVPVSEDRAPYTNQPPTGVVRLHARRPADRPRGELRLYIG